mmetsp:Transcript_26801/g.80411  ORF Transcript_26801/g.80411 Transcript_26801/m.80411 type:complete len:207 (+) Transcript_26801:182-802(+)
MAGAPTSTSALSIQQTAQTVQRFVSTRMAATHASGATMHAIPTTAALAADQSCAPRRAVPMATNSWTTLAALMSTSATLPTRRARRIPSVEIRLVRMSARFAQRHVPTGVGAPTRRHLAVERAARGTACRTAATRGARMSTSASPTLRVQPPFRAKTRRGRTSVPAWHPKWNRMGRASSPSPRESTAAARPSVRMSCSVGSLPPRR